MLTAAKFNEHIANQLVYFYLQPEGIKQEYTKGSFFCTDKGKSVIYHNSFKYALVQWVSPGLYESFSIIQSNL